MKNNTPIKSTFFLIALATSTVIEIEAEIGS